MGNLRTPLIFLAHFALFTFNVYPTQAATQQAGKFYGAKVKTKVKKIQALPKHMDPISQPGLKTHKSQPLPKGPMNLWDMTRQQASNPDPARRAIVLQLDNALVRRGYRFNSPEYFRAAMRQTAGRVRRASMINRGKGHARAAELDQGLVSPGNLLEGALYLVVFAVGTPAVTTSVVFDTGSAALWTLCNCQECTLQPLPNLAQFDPGQSTSFLSLNADQCQSLAAIEPDVWTPIADPSSCSFSSTYGDGSSLSGYGGADNLTLINTQGDNITYPVAFGCATKADPLAYSYGYASGIMGAGPTNDSVLGQLSAKNVLAWSLAVCGSRDNPSGTYVVMGRGPAPSQPLVSTPMVIKVAEDGTTNPYYYVSLKQLSVEGLPVTSSRGQMLIWDTGSAGTSLTPPLRQAVFNMIELLTGLTLNATDGCPLLESGNVTANLFPTITMEFDTGVFSVPPSAYLRNGCVLISTNPSESLIGIGWLADHYIQFDVEQLTVSWLPMNCSSGTLFTPPEGTTPPSSPGTPPSAPGTPPSPSSPPSLTPPGVSTPPSPAGVSVACTAVTSWPSGTENVTQYSCILSNTLPYPVTGVSLACPDFPPLAQWNIDANCSLPSSVLLSGQSLYFGYQTSSANPPSLANYTESQPSLTVLPNSDPSSPLTLTCNTTGVPWVLNDQVVYQYDCQLANTGTMEVNGLSLVCTNFVPTQQWNVNPDCSLATSVMYPGEVWSFGFQTTTVGTSIGLGPSTAMSPGEGGIPEVVAPGIPGVVAPTMAARLSPTMRPSLRKRLHRG